MDWEKSKDKWGDYPAGKIVDHTAFSPAYHRIQQMIQFLTRPDLIKKSYIQGKQPENIDQLRQSGGLRPDAGRSLVEILTNPHSLPDGRNSSPDPTSPFSDMIFEESERDWERRKPKRSIR
jgi:hypothetical protein